MPCRDGERSKVERMNSAEVLRAWGRYDRLPREVFPCEYGHLACSFEDDGPCGDELSRAAQRLGVDVGYGTAQEAVLYSWEDYLADKAGT